MAKYCFKKISIFVLDTNKIMTWVTGEAPIKSQYRVDLETVVKLKQSKEDAKSSTTTTGDQKRPTTDDDSEPKSKKSKIRGQNKPNQRKTNSEQEIVDRKEKLCPSFKVFLGVMVEK